MVTSLNISLDDSVHAEAERVKNDLGLTWAEFIQEAAAALDEREGGGD